MYGDNNHEELLTIPQLRSWVYTNCKIINNMDKQFTVLKQAFPGDEYIELNYDAFLQFKERVYTIERTERKLQAINNRFNYRQSGCQTKSEMEWENGMGWENDEWGFVVENNAI